MALWLYTLAALFRDSGPAQQKTQNIAHSEKQWIFGLLSLTPKILTISNFRVAQTGLAPRNRSSTVFFHGYSRLPCRISFWLSNDNSPPATSPELAKLVKLWQIHREFFIVIVAESVYYKRQNSARFCTNWTKNSKSCLVLVQHLRNIFKGDSWA